MAVLESRGLLAHLPWTTQIRSKMFNGMLSPTQATIQYTSLNITSMYLHNRLEHEQEHQNEGVLQESPVGWSVKAPRKPNAHHALSCKDLLR